MNMWAGLATQNMVSIPRAYMRAPTQETKPINQEVVLDHLEKHGAQASRAIARKFGCTQVNVLCVMRALMKKKAVATRYEYAGDGDRLCRVFFVVKRPEPHISKISRIRAWLGENPCSTAAQATKALGIVTGTTGTILKYMERNGETTFVSIYVPEKRGLIKHYSLK